MPIPNRDAVALSARTLGALFSYAPNSAHIAPLVAAFQDGSWQQQWPFPVTAPLASAFAASTEESLPEAWQRLFIGPWALPAPPWGSVWLDKESVLFGDSTLALREWMRTNGIALDAERNEPEDHFGTLLLLAAWLCETEKDALFAQLLAWHLLPWSGRFLSVFVDHAAHPFYQALGQLAQSLPAWRRLITPALGGLAAGTLLWLWQRRSIARPHAATDYMEALETGDGCFDTPASLVKSLASLLVVVTGSAIGREGAMILLAALAASLFARRFTPQTEWKLWVACGAAAGMASAYHAPLAGSLFIAEILFGTLMLASLGPVVISAVIALLLTQFLNGGAAPLYHVLLQQNLSALHYGLMLATGLLAGLCGPLFIWLMDSSHRGFVKLKLTPPWQLALGGLIVGGLSLITPAVWGNGYSVVQSYLRVPPSGLLLAGVFLCKLLAVLASSGSGAPGGVFTPTLFVGLAMGMLFASVSGLWLPGNEEMAMMIGLTGMAAFLAATTHAPIMSTLMICEMTGQYALLPGLLITCVVASVLSRTLRRDSIYRHHLAEHV
ncbi:TPA: voltage-gated ClC-type chloride channel ClcB [Klebsiella variicola]